MTTRLKFQTRQISSEVMKEYWTVVSLTLEDVANLLEKALGLSNLFFDSENVWMWLEAEMPDKTILNISREHDIDNGECLESNLRIMVTPLPFEVESLGKQFAKALKTRIYFGEVTYLGGDKFQFSPENSYEVVHISNCI